MGDSRQLHALVSGRVQGVGFRFFVVEEARLRGLTGWVRNLRGAQVEVLAEGPAAALEEFLAALREGPPLCWVESVVTDWSAAGGEFARFEVRPSAY